MDVPPSGEQWQITHGEQTAVITQAGATLRRYRVAGHDIVAGFTRSEPCSSGRGQMLAPWPNRIRDGRYELDGVEHQLPLSEPALGNASHGLARWSSWQLIEHDTDALTACCRIHAQPGWPGTLDVTATYRVDHGGLTVTIDAHNVGASRVPFGFGAHPYLAIGDAPLEDVTLHVPAATVMHVDAERKLPLAVEPVAGTGLDFRDARAIAATQIDNAFADLHRDADGRWRVTITAAAQPSATIWGDDSFGWVQVFTGKAAAGEQGERGIAVEPLTCPPDAFNSGTDLVLLAPGDRWRGTWGIEPGR